MFKKYIAICTFALSLAGCNFMDYDQFSGKNEEQQYGYFGNVQALITASYRELPADYGVLDNALRESATDNAVYTYPSSSVYDMYNGAWSPSNLVDNKWSAHYAVIRDVNLFLEKFDETNLERHRWDSDYEMNIDKVRYGLIEVRAMRAFNYFELVKRFGDVPLVEKSLTVDEANSVTRKPAAEIFDYIISECDAVIPDLKVNFDEFYGITGHVTKGAVMALKARAALYAASPLFNTDGDTELYKRAALAAKDIIDAGYYTLESMESDPLYSKNGALDVLNSKQLIFERRPESATNTFEKANAPKGFENGDGGNTPTQDLVDAFEYVENGVAVAFDWNNPTHVANMYANAAGEQTRDPRLYRKVLYNGSKFGSQTVSTYEGGANGLPLVDATMTGYYLKALMNETVNISTVAPSTKFHVFPMYRYAEVLLNYAEALNAWQGPTYTDSEFTLTAEGALNELRASIPMPAVAGLDQAAFAEKVKNERRIELAFEDHRFWDLRRWKEGEKIKNVSGVKITLASDGTPSYEKIESVQNRVWNDKMYLFPVPNAELFINSNLTQNPGW